MKIEGGCFCGAVRYRLDGPARRVTHCHCLHCRRTSGAPFLTWAEFDASLFTLLRGAPGSCETRPSVSRAFCMACGTQLTYRHADDTGTVDVTVASLDDPGALSPEDHVWCERMLPWMDLPDGLPRYDRGRS